MTICYASVNEDWRTEAAALRLGPEDTVLCVTGSGDRPLDLLALDPGQVVAVDRNPAQNHLLALKVAAMRHQGCADFAAFIGLVPAAVTWRRRVFASLVEDLEPGARAFWTPRMRMIERGVIYQGRWERFYRRAARVARRLRPDDLRRLFAFEDLAAQRRFLHEAWDRPFWRVLFRAACSRAASRFLLRDPAYYRHRAFAPGRWLHERMGRLLERCLARESFMVSLVLRGCLSPFDLPPYLDPTRYQRIRVRLDRLSVVTADAVDIIAQRAATFSRFSLSDIPSFLSRSGFEALLASLARGARPGARVVIRQFLTRYEMPPDLADALHREGDLERRLALEDRAFAYEFVIAEARGG